MTEQEKERYRTDAEALAIVIGGRLPALLGLRGGGGVVFRGGKFYIDGRDVPIAEIRLLMLQIEQRAAARMRAVRPGDPAWADETRRLITASHVLMAALAAGSIRAALEHRELERRILSELMYFDRFAASVRSRPMEKAVGSKPRTRTAAQTAARATSYLMAAAVTYTAVELARNIALGFTEAKRVRRRAESCEGCRRYAGIWMPIAEIPPIGTLDCGGRCRCYLTYR